MKKTCLKCNKDFKKKYNYSMNYWATQKFCSMSCAKLGRKVSVLENNKRTLSLKKFYSKKENKDMISKAREIQWKNGFKGSTGHNWKKTPEQLKNKMGIKNPAWKGGITPINTKIRNSQEYTDWRISVFKRDNYTCQECGSRGIELNADHIKPFAYYPELRLRIDNGRTMCVPCHKKTETYGGRAKNYKLTTISI